MNYLEELAYWYFRFNGYFLIQNYVNHRNNAGLDYTYESDFLGIRFPYVFENNVMDDDYENTLITSKSKIICVIGESKSGQYNIKNVFKSKEVIRENIFRFGFMHHERITKDMIDYLFIHNSWENEMIKIIKVLVVENENVCENEKYISITKNTIIDEINRRKTNFRKKQDRIFFNSNLLQYMFS